MLLIHIYIYVCSLDVGKRCVLSGILENVRRSLVATMRACDVHEGSRLRPILLRGLDFLSSLTEMME